jgi:SAM-dependent methyltransferase
MPSADIERRVADYYAAKLREHGPTHQGVDWNSADSQRLRFAQFMPILSVGKPVSVLDWGCGYGALAEYLEAQEVELTAYTGYDVSEEMVATARERSRWTFTAAREELAPADVSVASGVFNVRVDIDEQSWRAYTLDTIGELASLSRRALAFNMLTSYSDADRMTDRLYYGDPTFYFDWCKRHLSRNVALLHDYGLYEFTILVRL